MNSRSMLSHLLIGWPTAYPTAELFRDGWLEHGERLTAWWRRRGLPGLPFGAFACSDYRQPRYAGGQPPPGFAIGRLPQSWPDFQPCPLTLAGRIRWSPLLWPWAGAVAMDSDLDPITDTPLWHAQLALDFAELLEGDSGPALGHLDAAYAILGGHFFHG